MTKILFRTWALLLSVSTLILTTSCSIDERLGSDDVTRVQQGHQFPVTIYTASQSQVTRAYYNTETMRLSFNAGDQLLVVGHHANAGRFAGTLVWTSGVMFDGTITTEKQFTGTAYTLLDNADSIQATLLPNNYADYGYLTVGGTGCNTFLHLPAIGHAFADTKAHGVEQLSMIHSDNYNNGFALSAGNAILSCTVTGLSAYTDYVFTATDGTCSPSGTVTSDSQGQATFTVAFAPNGTQSYTIMIDNGTEYQDINIGSKTMESGCIYTMRLTASHLL